MNNDKTPPGAEPRSSKRYSVEQFMRTTKFGGSAFSHDEKSVLFHSNGTGIFNIFQSSASGGERTQLTSSRTESHYLVAAFPTDARFLYTSDKGGHENFHLYVGAPGAKELDITPGENTKAVFRGWSNDRKTFFFATNERDPKFFDIFEMKSADMSRALIYQDEVGYEFSAISNDKRFVAFKRIGDSSADSDIYLYCRHTGEMKNLTAHEGDVENVPQTFGSTSAELLYLSNEGTEFMHVRRYLLRENRIEVVQQADWDISATYFSRTGKYRIVEVNEDARTALTIYDEGRARAVECLKLPEGSIHGLTFADSEERMAFYHASSRSPDNLYVYDFTSDRLTRLTDSSNPEIDPEDLVDARVVHYPSFDGLKIPAILYRPHSATSQQRVPALVMVHGGPGGQARIRYDAVIQCLVNHRYAVLDVNHRGSSGYGKTFLAADDQKHGREPLWDCVEAKNYLASLDYINPARIGIMGASYGGYMVLAALAFQPDEFAVGVDLFGAANWLRILQSIPPYWESMRKALYAEIGNPETQSDMLREVSPLFQADRITKPLIVLQGVNDPRVPKAESDEIVDAIRRRGGIVEYVLFDDEGHGFSKQENEIRAYTAILTFLETHLSPPLPQSSSSDSAPSAG